MSPAKNYLIDSNLVVYAYDVSEPVKQPQAFALLMQLQQQQQAVLTTQVLGEFFQVVTRRIPSPLSLAEGAQRVKNLSRLFPVLGISVSVTLEAIRGVCEHKLAYWDAQLWACARIAQIPTVLSEDFSHGRSIEGVVFCNPFKMDGIL